MPNGAYASGTRAWRCGSLAGEEGGALRLYLDGPYRGRWRCYKSGAHGDPLDLICAVLFPGDFARGNLGNAFKWALDWLGLGDEIDAGTKERLEKQAAAAREKRQRAAEAETRRNTFNAKHVWLNGRDLVPGDDGWLYFLGRGVDLAVLPELPRAIRLHPSLYNPESQRSWPAIVAAICAPDGTHVNTHRIWLERRRDGSVGKAPLRQPKLSMPGGYQGGCVRLWKGASGKPWGRMPEGETVAAGEGLEDTLTITCIEPAWRYCAVLSVSNLAGLVLPRQVSRLVWIAQNDPKTLVIAGRRVMHPARRALAEGLKAHRQQGLNTFVIRPPSSRIKDVNELAQLEDDATELTAPTSSRRLAAHST